MLLRLFLLQAESVAKHVIEITALLLAIVAIVFAWIQYKDAKKLVKDLLEVEGALSTRFLGKFPSYMSDLEAMIKRANYSLTIFCDFPAYGAFSDSRSFLEFKHALESKYNSNPDFVINLVCLDFA